MKDIMDLWKRKRAEIPLPLFFRHDEKNKIVSKPPFTPFTPSQNNQHKESTKTGQFPVFQ